MHPESVTMVKWLNQNSAAIQAVATVASVLATAALALITWRYVRLTRTLAEATQAQAEFLREAVKARKRELLAVIKMLRILVGSLPEIREHGEQMREAASWDSNDLADLKRLASEFGTLAGQRAAVATPSLLWLKERVDDVKATDPRLGVNFNDFPWDRWDSELKRAKENLEALWNDLPQAHLN